MLLAIMNYLRSWHRYGLAVQELSQFNDRELADIGITRGDIPRIAWDHAGRADCVRQAVNTVPPAAALPTHH